MTPGVGTVFWLGMDVKLHQAAERTVGIGLTLLFSSWRFQELRGPGSQRQPLRKSGPDVGERRSGGPPVLGGEPGLPSGLNRPGVLPDAGQIGLPSTVLGAGAVRSVCRRAFWGTPGVERRPCAKSGGETAATTAVRPTTVSHDFIPASDVWRITETAENPKNGIPGSVKTSASRAGYSG